MGLPVSEDDEAPDLRARPRRRPDLLPLIVLVVLVVTALVGWWGFPALHRAIAFQDCTAAGRTDCGGIPRH